MGAGAWGTALAQAAAQAGRDVVLWAREADVVNAITRERRNLAFLPDTLLHGRIRATGDLAIAADADAVLIVTPAQHVRATLHGLGEALSPSTPLVLCAKGVERGTLALMTEIAVELRPDNRVAVLSGPSFARDVARGLPTAVTLACTDTGLAETLAQAIASPVFRPYISDDPIGAEVGGAVKNVLAIACGIVDGRGLGESARAALITRGFAEMTRLAVALGGRATTVAGLCGLGDLILTCSSVSSRNFSCGRALGEGRTLDEVLGGRREVTEGVASAPAVVALAAHHGVEMPICLAVDAVLDGRLDLETAIRGLMSRPLKSEM